MKIKCENRGFSLVELIVVIAIFAVVSVAVGGFMMAASRSYAVNANELNLQEEAQLVANQMQEMILDTAYGISYQYVVTDDTGVDLIDYMENDTAVLPEGDLTKKDLYIYGKDQYYHISWDKETEKLYLEEYEKNGAGDYVLAAGVPADGVGFGEYIHEFQVDLSKVASDRMVGFNIKFKKPGSDRDYLVTRTVSLRNDVMTNRTKDVFYQAVSAEFQPAADMLTITPNITISMWPGDMQQYRPVLTCSRGGVPNQTVSWNVESTDGTAISANTKMSSGSNLLQVGSDEKCKQLVLTASAVGYDYVNGEEKILTNPPLYVDIRRITGLTVTTHTFTEDIVPGSEYIISVKLEGENLPANVTDAGGIYPYVKVGSKYVTITQTDVTGLTATYSVQIADVVPVGQKFVLGFQAAKEGFTDICEEFETPEVINAETDVLVIEQLDTDKSKDWLRLGERKVGVKFKDSNGEKNYMKDGKLKNQYSIKYNYEFKDASKKSLGTATRTVSANGKTVTGDLSSYLSEINHNTVFEAEAFMTDKFPLSSGQVVVSAELVRTSDGKVLGKSNAVTYNVPKVSLSFRRAKDATPRTKLTVYLTPMDESTKENDVYTNKYNNRATIYVDYADGFAKNSKPTVDLEKFTITSGSDCGSIVKRWTGKNMLEIVGSTNSSKYGSNKKIVIKHQDLGTTFDVVLKKKNIDSGTYAYYVPNDASEWDKISATSSAYYIDDNTRMKFNLKEDGSLNSADVQNYVNLKWNTRRTYVKYSSNMWKQ